MKKLTRKQVRKNINNHLKLNGFEDQMGQNDRFECIVQGLLDSINECINPSFVGKMVIPLADKLKSFGDTPRHVKFKERFKCVSEKDGNVTINVDGKEMTFPKDHVYLCEDQ